MEVDYQQRLEKSKKRRARRACGIGLCLLGATLVSCGAHSRHDGPVRRLPEARLVEVRAQTVRKLLLAEEDIDEDRRVTIEDLRRGAGSDLGQFVFRDVDGRAIEVAGTYYLANLLEELTLATGAGLDVAALDVRRVFEPPVDRLSRKIRDLYWDALTRRIDARQLAAVVADPKLKTGSALYLWVPAGDAAALEYFEEAAQRPDAAGIRVEQLPAEVDAEWVQNLDGRHGLLSLALRDADGTPEGVPYVVPGGRFNEMYGWDSYFEALGLLADGRVDLARAMVDNLVYQIRHYGKILNANRTYYLTRSQPPFLTSMALAVYQRLPRGQESDSWLGEVLRAAIVEYETVWTTGARLIGSGLSRYFGSGIGPPPEVEPGHFDPIFRRFARRRGVAPDTFEADYREGRIREPELDRFFVHDRCVRESGHDTTYRWYDPSSGQDRCADFATVDLNALLYRYEIDLARAIDTVFDGCLPRSGECETSEVWRARASRRRDAIRAHLWDEDAGAFFDYNQEADARNPYWSATVLYPLWACHADDKATRLVTQDEAERLVRAALARLEQPGGLAASARESLPGAAAELGVRQWDYPHGWAPHQMIAWAGLANYGFDEDAQRLVYRWLYTITRNASWYNGMVPEKFDVVRRTHDVFAEYGNVGTEFEYITREGFGWMNASFQVGAELLGRDLRESLNRLVPPEWLFAGEQGGPADPAE